jgi:F-type H+-transporting ATPase subunit b
VKLLRLLAIVGALSLPALAFAQEGEHAAAGEAHEAAREGHGEGHGEHGEAHEAPTLDWGRLGWQILNFGALLFLLVKFGGPPVAKALAARHQQIKSDLASAAETRAAAQARFEQQEKRLASLEQEIATIAASIKQEAEAEKARLIALSEERARRIREESEFIIEQQIKQAEEDLRREVAAAAVALAEKIVRSQMGPGDQQRMIDSFVGDIATPNGARTNGTPHSGSASPAGRGAPRSEI